MNSTKSLTIAIKTRKLLTVSNNLCREVRTNLNDL